MYAVVEVAGSQFRVEQGDNIRVAHMNADTGEKVTIDRVLLISEDGGTRIGTPHIEDASVEASVLGHGKGDKVIVFKMKRRKGYRRKNGHRQPYTDLHIDTIAVAS